jgi:hypothetical protein
LRTIPCRVRPPDPRGRPGSRGRAQCREARCSSANALR